MSRPTERAVRVADADCRVLEAGAGEPLVWLAGLGGLPRWSPFLERLCEHRRVIVPSLPGFPGARGHDQLDGLIDWIAATLDLLEAIGAQGVDLVGSSIGATLAAEAVAFSPGLARRLVLVAPFGLFDPEEPTGDPWAQRPGDLGLLSAHPERLAELWAAPEGEDAIEWQVAQTRASEAAARVLWPLGDTGTRKRLHRVRVPTLVVWGSVDRVLPASYAKRYAEPISGPSELRILDGAGHLVDVDAPDALARAILEFLS